MDKVLDLANWMSKLPTELHEVPLRNLSIPGSHDSGGYFLDKSSKIAPDESNSIKALARIFGQCAKNIVYKWAITQTLSTYQQLEQGVRYFDLRVAFEESSKEYCFVHGLYGQSYQLIFKDIKEFLKQHPKEVLILDFNHLWDFTAEDFTAFMELIDKSFSGLLYGPPAHGVSCSLSDIWSSKKQIIVFYSEEAGVIENPNFWSRRMIFSPWYNTAKVEDLLGHLNSRFDTLKADCYNVFQAILSPQTSTILWHLINGSLKVALAENCDKMVCSWLKKVEEEKKKGVNIVICDFVDLFHYSPLVVSLNYMQCK